MEGDLFLPVPALAIVGLKEGDESSIGDPPHECSRSCSCSSICTILGVCKTSFSGMVGERGGDGEVAFPGEDMGLTYFSLDEDDVESPSRLLWLLLWALGFLLLLPD